VTQGEARLLPEASAAPEENKSARHRTRLSDNFGQLKLAFLTCRW